MRHFLNNIQIHIENKNYMTALDYIRTTIDTINNVAIIRFCSNDLVNAVISHSASEMKKHQIKFDYSIQIEKELTFKGGDVFHFDSFKRTRKCDTRS